MSIKRFVKHPIPPEVSGQNPEPVTSLTKDSDTAYEVIPEPLRSAIISGKVDVTSLPVPLFDQITKKLNPLINLEDYR